MARKKRGRRAYATDLGDTQWALIAGLIPEAEPGGRAGRALGDPRWALVAGLIPEAEPGGRPRKTTSRELVNAILYFLRAGMAWRLLPHDLPPWQTVYYSPRRWPREGGGDRVPPTLVMADRGG